ncbi:MAG TPA: NRDE family protein [Deferrisomatales bacterium]|nr:NRDE family protein [Deferrisomatales bacterium]
MCTLHLFYRVFPDAPVLFAANRDEDLGRPWRPPEVLAKEPWIYGPRDLTAGGTWLGVNRTGVLVSLANHFGTLRAGSPSLCSRGTVVLEALRHGSAREAVEFATRVAPVCKAYTLLVADPERAYVVDNGEGGTQTYRLMPGRHVITNARFRDPDDPKARRCLARMEQLPGGPTPGPESLFPFLSDHQAAAEDSTPLCIHPAEGTRFGTSSASVVSITRERRISGFWFAAGPPCSTAPANCTPLPGE